MKKLTIVNRSGWPDWFVQPVVQWIVRQTGITWHYTVTLPMYKNVNCYAGRGWTTAQRTRINRRITDKGVRQQEHRFHTGQVCNPQTRLEAFVFLVAHEARHATPFNQALFRVGTDGCRDNNVAGEHDANEWGNEMVERFRASWPSMKRLILKRLRRRKVKTVLARIGPSRADKIAKNRAALARWERKAKLAQTWMSKYRRRIAALERHDRRAATRPS